MNLPLKIDIRHSTCPHDCPSACALDVEVIENGKIGRIRGYPGEDHFWGLLGVMIKQLDRPGTGDERAELPQKALHASD